MESRPLKYAAVSSAVSRFGPPSSALLKVPSSFASAGVERVQGKGVVLKVSMSSYSYEITIVLTKLSSITSPACVSVPGMMLTTGLGRQDMSEEAARAFTAKRKPEDAGLQLPKDRVLSSDPNDRLPMVSTTDVRISVEKKYLESVVKGDVLVTLKPGSVIEFVDTDPSFYYPKADKVPKADDVQRNTTLVTKLSSRSVSVGPSSNGENPESLIERSTHYQMALFNSLVSTRKMMPSEVNQDLCHRHASTVFDTWNSVGKAYQTVNVHARQPDRNEANDHFKSAGEQFIALSKQDGDADNASPNNAGGLFNKLVDSKLIQSRMSTVFVHNPHSRNTTNATLQALLDNTSGAEAFPPQLVTNHLEQLEISEEKEIVAFHLVPSVIFPKDELERMNDDPNSASTQVFFTENDETPSVISLKIRLAFIGSAFGHVNKSVAKKIAMCMGNYPWYGSIKALQFDANKPINTFMSDMCIDVKDILINRGIRISTTWMSEYFCDSDTQFIQYEDEGTPMPYSFPHEAKTGQPPYENFQTNGFMCMSVSKDYPNRKKLEKAFKQITDNKAQSDGDSSNLALYYAVLPLVPYDPTTFAVSCKTMKVTSTEREEYINSMIDTVGEGGNLKEKAADFFANGKGLMYAFFA